MLILSDVLAVMSDRNKTILQIRLSLREKACWNHSWDCRLLLVGALRLSLGAYPSIRKRILSGTT